MIFTSFPRKWKGLIYYCRDSWKCTSEATACLSFKICWIFGWKNVARFARKIERRNSICLCCGISLVGTWLDFVKLAIIHQWKIFKNSSLPPLQSKFFVEHGGRGDSSSLPEPFIKLTCSHSRGTINPLTSYPPPAPNWRDFILATGKARKCQHDRN